ncbi:hypothetical protein Adt_32224 [Abeliophyllum distichum]|uniref:Uncharacterized protein n=1 Tax=Abeliophyllum distichum TaxID=126358 RepID=A0ABD1RGJ1_9LAMI
MENRRQEVFFLAAKGQKSRGFSNREEGSNKCYRRFCELAMETRLRPEDVRRSLGCGFLGQKSHSTSERIWGWCDMQGGCQKRGVVTLPLVMWIKVADCVLHVHSLHYKEYTRYAGERP